MRPAAGYSFGLISFLSTLVLNPIIMLNHKITFRALLLLLAALLFINPAPAHAKENHQWQELLTGDAGLSIALTPAPCSPAYTISFRHRLGGYARITLTLRQVKPDGVTQDYTFTASSFPYAVLLPAGAIQQLPGQGETKISGLQIDFFHYGEHYELSLDGLTGSRALTRNGKPYNYAPGFALINPLLFLPAPVNPPVTQQAIQPEVAARR